MIKLLRLAVSFIATFSLLLSITLAGKNYKPFMIHSCDDTLTFTKVPEILVGIGVQFMDPTLKTLYGLEKAANELSEMNF